MKRTRRAALRLFAGSSTLVGVDALERPLEVDGADLDCVVIGAGPAPAWRGRGVASRRVASTVRGWRRR